MAYAIVGLYCPVVGSERSAYCFAELIVEARVYVGADRRGFGHSLLDDRCRCKW